MADQPDEAQEQAQAPLHGHAAQPAEVIPGEYIVVLKTKHPGGKDRQYREELLNNFQRDIEDNIEGSLTVTGSVIILPAVFVTADDTAIQQLRAHPSVSYIEANMRCHAIS